MPLRLIPDIHRATHRIELYLERLEDLNVTQAEAHILAHLASVGPCTVAALNRALGHKRSTLSSILDRLARRGLALREVSSDDRRTFVIRLTRPGTRLADRVYEQLEAFESRVLNGVPPARVEALRALLVAIEEAAEAPPETRRARRLRTRSTGR